MTTKVAALPIRDIRTTTPATSGTNGSPRRPIHREHAKPAATVDAADARHAPLAERNGVRSTGVFDLPVGITKASFCGAPLPLACS
jgi:hypothetical protein